jgi:hypothetical protein
VPLGVRTGDLEAPGPPNSPPNSSNETAPNRYVQAICPRTTRSSGTDGGMNDRVGAIALRTGSLRGGAAPVWYRPASTTSTRTPTSRTPTLDTGPIVSVGAAYPGTGDP